MVGGAFLHHMILSLKPSLVHFVTFVGGQEPKMRSIVYELLTKVGIQLPVNTGQSI